jgi:CopG family nickel-responsive transcriptional regulator
MSKVSRFSVSLPQDLLQRFDEHVEREKYPTRSKAIADLVREGIVRSEWPSSSEVAGAIVLVYDHHKRELHRKLLDLQHRHHAVIVSNQHIHLDHDNCLEIIAVKGDPQTIAKLAGKLKTAKGIASCNLSISVASKD